MANYQSKLALKLLIFITILILINALCLSYDPRLDLDAPQSYRLSPHTIKVLQELNQPVKLLCFFRSSDGRQAKAKAYLTQFETESNLVSSEFYDPDLEPEMWQKYDLEDGGIIFMTSGKTYEVDQIDEIHLTKGLLAVTQPQSEPSGLPLFGSSSEVSPREMPLNFLEIVFVLFMAVLLIPFTFVTLSLLVWWQRR